MLKVVRSLSESLTSVKVMVTPGITSSNVLLLLVISGPVALPR